MTKIFITEFDLKRLRNLLEKQQSASDYTKALDSELSRAEVVESKAIPADVITMNSRVSFKDEAGNKQEYSLVFPEDADITAGKISVLSPIGCSLIGYKVGDKISIPMPKGNKELTIQEILYQPEKSGDLDL